MIPRFHSRALPRSLRIELTVAVAVSALALAAIATSARAQQAPGTLPPIVVAPPPAIKKAPAKKAATVPAKKSPEPASQLGTYNPALDLPGLTLPPGTTLTTAGPVLGYRALTATSSTKTATPIEQIPQSIQVMPRNLLEEQKTLTMNEALQNASNVYGQNSRSLGDDTFNIGVHKIRGLAAEQWLDGMNVPGNQGDLNAFANIERIEVLKGPNAILYGGGVGAPIGGAINIVSKLPTDKSSAEAGLTVGSHRFFQSYLDLNQPLNANKTILFRLTSEYTSSNNYVNVLDQDRYSINPTVTLTNKTDTTLTIQGRASRVNQQTYQGLPAFGTVTGNFNVDPRLFIGPTDIPRGFSDTKGITVSFDHKFDSIFSAHVKGRWSRSESDQKTQLITSFDSTGAAPAFAPSTWLLANSELYQEQEERSVAANMRARFRLGESKNTLLFGGDYSRVRNSGFLTADYLGNAACLFFADCAAPSPTTPVDLRNPAFTIPYRDPSLAGQTVDFTSFSSLFSQFVLGTGPIGQFASFSNFSDVYTTRGAYGQLQSTLWDRVHLLGGLRLANVSIEHFESALTPPRTTATDATKALPRAGIVVDLVAGLSVYASYSEGMKAVSSLNLIESPKPEETVQREAGFKFKFNEQVTGTVSRFEIQRNNIPVVTGLSVTSLSNQISQGYEADLLWQPNRHWSVLANYGHADVTFASARGAIPAGAKVPGVPEHSGRLWLIHKFAQPALDGWSVGAGAYFASSQFVDSANLYKTPGYHTIDARIAYDTPMFSAALNVKNLTGEQYYVPYSFLGGQVAPGDDRAYYGTLVVRF